MGSQGIESPAMLLANVTLIARAIGVLGLHVEQNSLSGVDVVTTNLTTKRSILTSDKLKSYKIGLL